MSNGCVEFGFYRVGSLDSFSVKFEGDVQSAAEWMNRAMKDHRVWTGNEQIFVYIETPDQEEWHDSDDWTEIYMRFLNHLSLMYKKIHVIKEKDLFLMTLK